MTDKKNALAELAEEIQGIVTYIYYGSGECGAAEARKIAMAQRIISVLASYYEPCFPAKSGDDVIDECRAVAEEGAKDEGK